MKIAILEKAREDDYEKFLLSLPETLLYSSLKYRDLLRAYLKAKDNYFIALDESDKIIGILPSFTLENEHGVIINSLPFYGSNGGVTTSEENKHEITKALVGAFEDLSTRSKSISSTIITSPFCDDHALVESRFKHDFKDERIGQVTVLPRSNVPGALMDMFHHKTRNMIRKAEKSSMEIVEGNDAMDFIAEVHHENIAAIGGIPKESDFFKLIPGLFNRGKDYKIFIARKDNVIIAGLLLFYYNNTVEYFTPVVKSEYRTYQPLSLLIYEAMKEAASIGYKFWNWGGTWLTQEGVYMFKKRWGTIERPYYYYTSLHDDSILRMSKKEVLLRFSNFYVVPFNKLENE